MEQALFFEVSNSCKDATFQNSISYLLLCTSNQIEEAVQRRFHRDPWAGSKWLRRFPCSTNHLMIVLEIQHIT
jgi:hypothetical protein